MHRTLFSATIDATLSDESARRDADYYYAWVPDVTTLRVGGQDLLVNPRSGAWAVEACRAPHPASRASPAPQADRGEFLYQVGLAARNGSERFFPTRSDYTEQLYFFEFAVTDGCNLACKYCFASARPARLGERATPEIAELFVDRIAEHRSQTRSNLPYIVEFTGGEPLLNFQAIRHAVEYADRTYGRALNVRFVIQSNATLVTESILDFLVKHDVGLGVSCDGIKRIHDDQRPFAGGAGSHKAVMRNLALLLRRHPANTGAVITVITRDGESLMPETALYLYLQGATEIALRPMGRLGRAIGGDAASPSVDAYVDGLFRVLTSVITPIFRETGEVLRERFLSLTFQHLLHPYRSFMCERSPCGAARNICVVLPGGDVYPCNQFVGEADALLGSIREHSLAEMTASDFAQSLAQRAVDAIDECRSCPFSGWCGSPCPHGALLAHGALYSRSPDCELLRARYRRALEGLLRDEFDLTVVGRLAGFDAPIEWREAPGKEVVAYDGVAPR